MTSSAENAEQVVARLRPHGRALFWPSMMLIVAAGATSYFAGSFELPWQNLAVLGAGFVLITLLWFIPLMAWLGTRYVVTTRRLIIRTGLVVRIRQELLHSRGYDVTVRKNAFQSLWGSGDVVINAGQEHPLRLRDVPNANLMQGALNDLVEKNLNSIGQSRAVESPHPDDTTRWGQR